MNRNIAEDQTVIDIAGYMPSLCLVHEVTEAKECVTNSYRSAIVENLKTICLRLKWHKAKQEDCIAQGSQQLEQDLDPKIVTQ